MKMECSIEKSNYLISIVVPVYNAELYLEQCIDSIVKQTYANIEVILVNDGSLDNSYKIMESYAAFDKRIMVIDKVNGGANSARKVGVEKASGDYIMFVDADDYIEKSLCEKLLLALLSSESQMSMCRISKVTEVIDGKSISVIGKLSEGKYSAQYIAENIIDSDVFFNWNVVHTALWGKLYETYIVKKVFDVIDERVNLLEDYMALILILNNVKYVYCSEEVLYYYKVNATSVTFSYSKSKYEDLKVLNSFVLQFFNKNKVSQNMYKQLEWIIIFGCLTAAYDAFKGQNYLYPFKDVKKGSKIVLYGAGKFGMSLEHYIKESNAYDLVLWVDKNWESLKRDGVNIEAVSKISDYEYDYIVIAVLNVKIAKKIHNDLVGMGIDDTKIACVSQELITYDELPKEFFE